MDTRFSKGSVPWNKGTKGVIKANSGSFQKGRTADIRFSVGDTTVRIDKKNGKSRTWIKVSDNHHSSYDWRLRAVVVWEEVHGTIAKGFVVHHKDRNTLNDALDNLELLSRADHLKEHKHEFEDRRIRGLLSRGRDSNSSETVL